jgi:hypothetical protein
LNSVALKASGQKTGLNNDTVNHIDLPYHLSECNKMVVSRVKKNNRMRPQINLLAPEFTFKF